MAVSAYDELVVLSAYEALVAVSEYDDDREYEALVAVSVYDELVALSAYEALVVSKAYDDEIAYEALVALSAYDELIASGEYDADKAYEALIVLSEYDDETEYDALVAASAYDDVPENDPVNDVAVILVFTCKPSSGEIEADTLPEDICDRFKPTIADAGIPYKSAPEPLKLPLNASASTDPDMLVDPVTVKDPDIVISYASIPVNASTDWETCPGLTIPRETIEDLSSIFAIYFIINM